MSDVFYSLRNKRLEEPSSILIKKGSILEIRGRIYCPDQTCGSEIPSESLDSLQVTLVQDCWIDDPYMFDGAKVDIVNKSVISKNEKAAKVLHDNHLKYHKEQKARADNREIKDIDETIRILENQIKLLKKRKVEAKI